jgi:glycosyltransferase involved in cell wall biosynthesis
MITTIIPAYNSEKTIANVVRRAANFVDKVLVVDDGSVDNTAAEARKAGAKVILHSVNKGKAGAIRTGLKNSKGIVVMLDSDLQHLPEEIPKVIDPIISGGADLSIGSRFLGNPERMPLHRKTTNFLSKLAIKIRTNYKITDVQSGFRGLGKKIRKLDLESAKRYDIETVMLLRAIEEKLKIVEVPITTIYGKPSYFNNWFDGPRAVWALMFK